MRRATLTADLDAVELQLVNIAGDVAAYIAAQILVLDNDLQAQITSNDGDISSLIDDASSNGGSARRTV